MTNKIKFTWFIVLLAVISCFFLLRWISNDSLNIGHGVYFEKFESRAWYCYYSGDKTQNGFLEGITQKALWNNDVLLVYIQKCWRGDKDGWYYVDLKTKEITGPVHDLMDKFQDMKRQKVNVFYLTDDKKGEFELKENCPEDMAKKILSETPLIRA